jgi:hypothetical protein
LTAPTFVLVTAVQALFVSAPEARPPPCFEEARALVKKIETLHMSRRGRMIELAIESRPDLLCGLFPRAFFTTVPALPAGCKHEKPSKCEFPKGLKVSPTLADEVEPNLYFRTQLIATKMREQALLSDAHARLLETLLLSGALAREEARKHGH